MTKVAISLALVWMVTFHIQAQNKITNPQLQLKSGDNLVLVANETKTRAGIDSKLIVFISLSEICMISQYYSKILGEMATRFQSRGVEFRGVFPNPFSNDTTIADFQVERSIPFPLFRDPKGLFCQHNALKVTPEVVIADPLLNIVYRGRIDDYYVAIGRFRAHATRHDLANAITQYLEGNEVHPKWVQPVGCFIDGRLWK